MTSNDSRLQQGIEAARVGQREQARTLLMQVVGDDERNEQAWLWLSGVMDSPEDQRVCLENVLDLNPRNDHARQGLAWLDTHHPQPVAQHEQPNGSQELQPHQPATGPTVALASGMVPAIELPTAPVKPLPPIPAGLLPVIPNPCPYCGEPSNLNQQSCRVCKRSLMVRGDVRAKSSIFLLFLALIWDFIALGNAISTLLLFFVTVLAFQNLGGSDGVSAQTSSAASGSLLTATLFSLLLTACVIWVTVGIYRRQRWAYVVNWVAVGLQLVSALLTLVAGAALLSAVQQVLAAGPNLVPPWLESLGTTLLVAIPLCGLAFVALWIALSVLSLRDFYGRMVRVLTEVPERKADEHYNMGVTYKNRGMWYMAACEWEQAVKLRGGDADYRRALGLAYAQIKDFGRAIRELRYANDMRPGDAQLAEDLALVEKLALR